MFLLDFFLFLVHLEGFFLWSNFRGLRFSFKLPKNVSCFVNSNQFYKFKQFDPARRRSHSVRDPPHSRVTGKLSRTRARALDHPHWSNEGSSRVKFTLTQNTHKSSPSLSRGTWKCGYRVQHNDFFFLLFFRGVLGNEKENKLCWRKSRKKCVVNFFLLRRYLATIWQTEAPVGYYNSNFAVFA